MSFPLYAGLTNLDSIMVTTFFNRDHFEIQEYSLVLFHSDCKSGSLPTHLWKMPPGRLCLRRSMSL